MILTKAQAQQISKFAGPMNPGDRMEVGRYGETGNAAWLVVSDSEGNRRYRIKLDGDGMLTYVFPRWPLEERVFACTSEDVKD